jgi:serine/threonine protein kinase
VKKHFCALVLREGQEHEVYRTQILPFLIEEDKIIGKGSVGTVYKVRIAKHHWVDKWLSNPEDIFLAIKKFKDASNDKQKHGFKNEFENLMKLKNASIKSDSVMLPLASLLHGVQRYLIYDLADMTLQDFLWETPKGEYIFSPTMTIDVIKNATDLVGALHWIHQYEPYHQIWHGDIKPENILIVTRNSRARWKLADFDRSHFQTTSLDTISSATKPIEARTYRAPEVVEGKGGRRSDVWSMGCILSLILSWLDDGPTSVGQFQSKRAEQLDPSMDWFCRAKGIITDPSLGDGHVLSPQVREWLHLLRDKASHRSVEDGDNNLGWYAKYIEEVILHIIQRVFVHRDNREYAIDFYAFMDKAYSGIKRPEASQSARLKSSTKTPLISDEMWSLDIMEATEAMRPQSSADSHQTNTFTPPEGINQNAVPPNIATPFTSNNSPPRSHALATQSEPPKCSPLCSDIQGQTYGDFQQYDKNELNQICRTCGDRPVHKAIRETNPDCLDKLVKTKKIEFELKNGREGGLTPMILSCKEDQLWAAKTLYREGARLDIKGKEYRAMRLPDRITNEIKSHIKRSKKGKG